MTHTHDDHDTVVVRDGGGSGAGMIVGVILVVALLAAIWYFALGPGQGTFGGDDVNVNVPEDMNVDVNMPSDAPAS